MPLSHIEHFLVAADDIDATRDWYARVLGMTSGPHPDFGFPVHWMYLGGVDVVHIGPSAKMAGAIQKQYLGRTSQESEQGTGAIDHIAFRATGLRADAAAPAQRRRSLHVNDEPTARRCSSFSSTTRTASRSSSTSTPPRPKASRPS